MPFPVKRYPGAVSVIANVVGGALIGLLTPALAAPSAAVATDGGVLGRELVPVVAVGASGVLVAESVDLAGAPSPLAHVCGLVGSPFGGGQLLTHRFLAPLAVAGAALAVSGLGSSSVFWGELVTLSAVGFVGVVVGTVLGLVASVVRWCVPAQILQPVVEAVAVVVARFHSWWARANEGFQHQAVDIPIFPGDSHAQILFTDRSGWGGFQDAAIAISYSSEVADFVGNESTHDRLPGFRHSPNCTVEGISMVGVV